MPLTSIIIWRRSLPEESTMTGRAIITTRY